MDFIYRITVNAQEVYKREEYIFAEDTAKDGSKSDCDEQRKESSGNGN